MSARSKCWKRRDGWTARSRARDERRAAAPGQENRGLTRPELAVVLSISKIVLQDAAEDLQLADDPLLEPQLFDAFPKPMRKAHADAIRAHRLRHEIVATKVANRLVNRLGPGVAFDLTEEEGASLQQVIVAFLVAERLLDLDKLWKEIEEEPLPEAVRVELFTIAAASVRAHISDILRSAGGETSVSKLCRLLEPGVRKIAAAATKLIRTEVRNEAAARRDRLIALGASEDIVRGLVRLVRARRDVRRCGARRSPQERTSLALTRAYTRLGEALGLDWAQQQVARFVPADQWERLLDGRARARFRAIADRLPARAPRQRIPTRSSKSGSRSSGRGSNSSAT